MDQIKVTFDDGKKRSFHRGTKVGQIIDQIFPDISKDVIAVILNGKVSGLDEKVESDSTIKPLTCNEPQGLQVFWHSGSHVMAQAVKALYPDVKLGIGPAVSNGFYYDFNLSETISSEDFEKIERKMREIVELDQPFIKKVMDKKEAAKLFKEMGEDFKVELINEIPDDKVSIYQNGDFIDLCRGPHVVSTGLIKHFKLLSVAGAYWKGDERNPIMQRIYGIAFSDEESLKRHLNVLEEAKRRDHRRLGKELDLFSFHIEGPGFTFWHGNGMIIYNQIMDYMRETLTRHGYREIKTPIILNEELWHRSGHWDNYKDNMYFTKIDDKNYAIKPMNCPGCLLIYKNSHHSYRELPIKFSEMGLVHRHEKSGVLHGLFRVRQFTQDDAHVFCSPDQMEEEIVKLIDLVYEIYNTFGFENFQIELSTRPAKFIGTIELWEKAEEVLMKALELKNIEFQINRGEGAFYGPKIDFHIEDSLKRLWQCGTIQVDFSMPERFGLEYVDADGLKHRPVMIHRAILGSIERFIGILIEHYGGVFPTWLAPVQCVLMPISEKHHEYSKQIYEKITSHKIRCKLDDRNEKIGYKIREAESNKIKYMCIIGDRESKSGTISLRKKGEGDIGQISPDKFIEDILDEIKRRV